MNKIEKLKKVLDACEVVYEDINENEILVLSICDRIPYLDFKSAIEKGQEYCCRVATSCETDEAHILISYNEKYDSLEWGIFLKDYKTERIEEK